MRKRDLCMRCGTLAIRLRRRTAYSGDEKIQSAADFDLGQQMQDWRSTLGRASIARQVQASGITSVLLIISKIAIKRAIRMLQCARRLQILRKLNSPLQAQGMPSIDSQVNAPAVDLYVCVPVRREREPLQPRRQALQTGLQYAIIELHEVETHQTQW